MSYNVEQIKKIWNQLSDTEKNEFTTFLFNNSKKSLREGFESFSVNKSTTMQFGDVNVCPACGK